MSNPAQGTRGGRAEHAMHTDRLLKVSAGWMDETQNLSINYMAKQTKFFPRR